MEASLKTREWLAERQTGIGGSDAAAVLGLSPYKTPLEVYNEKVADEPVVTEENPAMRWGKILEDPIAQEYAEQTGRKIQRVNQILRHPHYTYLIANIDRRIVGDVRGPGILEVKTVNGWVAKAWDDRIPVTYWAQVQHYMLVTGYTWADVAILKDGRDFEIVPVERDFEFHKMVVEAYERFWNDHVVPHNPPPPSTEEDVRRLFERASEGSVTVATEAMEKAHNELVKLQEREKAIAVEISKLKIAVQSAMGEAETVIAPDETPLFTWKNTVSNRLDSKALKADHPDIYSQYTKPSESRRFLIK